MRQPRPWQSVVTRLVGCLVVGGLLLTVGLSVLDMTFAERRLQRRVAEQVQFTANHLRTHLVELLPDGDEDAIRETLALFVASDPVQALQLAGPDAPPLRAGDWTVHDPVAWSLDGSVLQHAGRLDLGRQNIVQSSFIHLGRPYQLRLLVDGPTIRDELQDHTLDRLATQGLLLAVMLFTGLLLVRRWFTGPLSEIVEQLDRAPDPRPFQRLAQQKHDEFGRLAGSIAAMLQRIQSTACELGRRERAVQSLYQFAPAAMLSLNPQGRITDANHRAADLLGVTSAQSLVGRRYDAWICPADRPLLQLTLDRLIVDDTGQCQLRVKGGGRQLDAAVEAVAVRDEDGIVQSIRLSLLDVSPSQKLQRQLEDQSRLLHMVIEHMADAVLLVDARGQVAAFNRPLATLLGRPPELLRGSRYEPATFWNTLGAHDREEFLHRIGLIEADPRTPTQERFATRAGMFLFRGIPLRDAGDERIGRLWVVRDATTHEQGRRLREQQGRQLDVLKQIDLALDEARGLNAVMQRTTTELLELLQIDAVGIILGDGRPGAPHRQLLHRGAQAYLLEPHRELIQAVQREVLPLVLARADMAHWPDLPRKARWSGAFAGAGFTCLGAVPLRSGDRLRGMVWVARRGGERLEWSELEVLKTVLPAIASRIQIALLHEQLLAAEPRTAAPQAVAATAPHEDSLALAASRP